MHGVLADRAQQGTYEAAAAVAAHNQQVRAFGLLDKHCGRMTALHQLVHHNIGMRSGGVVDGSRERLPGNSSEIFSLEHGWTESPP